MTLKDARELSGLTQVALERLAGVKPGTVHDIESGRNNNPSLQTAANLVAALKQSGLKGITIEQVFPIATTVRSEEE